ncbi:MULTISPECIES: class I SAM-dependent methyltransferase [unclassified Phaeobacter]|uniref:class I SAM-dependent methyltransferase n=1 Tax=unclassified Phaeobacter TaxID=2621772 RepID=UPI003A8B6B34
MGKRSSFDRVPRDFYPTPPEAVTPLIPHLVEGWSYWEPCAGDGALVKAMPSWFPCGACSDIEPRGLEGWMQEKDALKVSENALWHIDCIITNPPWDRKVLHPMIEHFSAMRPTWLLFDADWMHTKQAAPFMPWLRKVVSVGRVKWIKDSPHTGKDNCAWYLFDQNGTGPCEFVGRAS